MGINKIIKRWLSNKILNLLNETNKKPPFLITKTDKIKVGKESYHNGNFNVKGNGSLILGSYCAFGQDIKVILSNHNYNYPSIQYTFYRKNFGRLPYENIQGNTEIGNDVWIGDSVIILPNIKIGNGVIIGAGSIVTKDVPDYAIIAGNPARVIKYRFTKEKIDELNTKKWWNWTNEEIYKNSDFFFKKSND